MSPLEGRPLFTRSLSGWQELQLSPDAVYMWGDSVEPRSKHPSEWEAREFHARFVKCLSKGSVSLKTEGSISLSVQLRSKTQMEELIGEIGGELYLNITGLPYHIWVVILKHAIQRGVNVHAVYVEPFAYVPSGASADSLVFDLSERILGISSLPGFARLTEPLESDNVYFVPVLGFEGARLAYALNQIEIPYERILPIVGSPGFRPDYPFHTYLGNRGPFEDSPIWQNVRFATANCPFSLMYTLQDIASEYPNARLKVAPLGTRPHALGAVMFAIRDPERIELVYDHPLPKANRSIGSGILQVYELIPLWDYVN